MKHEGKSIILFDGVCNLCNKTVQFVLKRDTKQQFYFASLQSDVGQELLLHYYDKNTIDQLDSIVFITNNRAYQKSTAALKIAKTMHFPYSMGVLFFAFPEFIRDYLYDIIAKYRYRWFGKSDVCFLPNETTEPRFLD